MAEQLSGKITEAYFDYQKTLQLEPKFAPAAEHLKDFVVTKGARRRQADPADFLPHSVFGNAAWRNCSPIM